MIHLNVQNTCAGQSVYVVAHDWGAIMAYFLAMKHPTLIKVCVHALPLSHTSLLSCLVFIIVQFFVYLLTSDCDIGYGWM
jgi:pimeloyl-ACP methyl ester carboxylesterase